MLQVAQDVCCSGWAACGAGQCYAVLLTMYDSQRRAEAAAGEDA